MIELYSLHAQSNMLRVNYEIMHECFLSCSDYMPRPWWTEIRLSQCDWQYSWLHCSLQMWLWLWASWRAIPWVPLQWLPEWKRTSVQTEVIKLSTRYYSSVHLWLSSTIINNMDAFSRAVIMCPDLVDPRYSRFNVRNWQYSWVHCSLQMCLQMCLQLWAS